MTQNKSADRLTWELAAARLKEQNPDWRWVFWSGGSSPDDSPAAGHNAGVPPNPHDWPDGGALVDSEGAVFTVKAGQWVAA